MRVIVEAEDEKTAQDYLNTVLNIRDQVLG
jgi:hypothetical protein